MNAVDVALKRGARRCGQLVEHGLAIDLFVLHARHAADDTLEGGLEFLVQVGVNGGIQCTDPWGRGDRGGQIRCLPLLLLLLAAAAHLLM